MALDFGGAEMFQRPGLYENGNLSERWGQEDSEQFDFTWNAGTTQTVHTVTAGKVFYVSELIVNNTGADAGAVTIKDGGAGGTVKLTIATTANVGDMVSFIFPTPLKFETDIYSDEGNSVAAQAVLSGWEEDE